MNLPPLSAIHRAVSDADIIRILFLKSSKNIPVRTNCVAFSVSK